MKKLFLAAAVATAIALPAAAAPESYTLDPNHTYPSFEVMHLGFSIQRGRFNKTAGKITLDTAAKKGSADITIDAASIDTGNAKLGEHLRGEDFLDVAKNPTLTFKSTNFTFDGDKVKTAAGDLTMHGVTKPVVLTATYFNCGSHPMTKKPVCGGEFTTTIKRSDFGMKYALPALADDVLLRINVEAPKD